MKINYSSVNTLFKSDTCKREQLEKDIIKNKDKLLDINKEGCSMTGWVDYPEDISKDVINDILQTAKEIKEKSRILLVIGIGGSYLGTKAIFEALNSQRREHGELKVMFAGFSLSSTYTSYLMKYLENKDFSIIYVSKSGNTAEPKIAFRLFRNLLKTQHGSTYKEWIYITTSSDTGSLIEEAKTEGYKTFFIPDNIGGRFSCFTAGTLLPLACKDVDICQFIEGAKVARADCINKKCADNIAMQYAYARNLCRLNGKVVEALCVFSPRMFSVTAWWQQLFAESEGKDGKGVLPVGLSYSTDLHSIGQFVQDGNKIMYETILDVKYALMGLSFPYDETNLDDLNYLAGRDIHYINNKMLDATVEAHSTGNVPVIKLKIEKIDTYNLGYLMYTFMFSCAISAYTLGVNPFDQPAVQVYKDKMYQLLKEK